MARREVFGLDAVRDRVPEETRRGSARQRVFHGGELQRSDQQGERAAGARGARRPWAALLQALLARPGRRRAVLLWPGPRCALASRCDRKAQAVGPVGPFPASHQRGSRKHRSPGRSPGGGNGPDDKEQDGLPAPCILGQTFAFLC